jgi:hypothetical protein
MPTISIFVIFSPKNMVAINAPNKTEKALIIA